MDSELETLQIPDGTEAGEAAAAVALTPPDVLWTALFGFPPQDPMFRSIDGTDPARTVATLLSTAGLGGFPIQHLAGEMCWDFPQRLDAASVAAASSVLTRALDFVDADVTAAATFDGDGRDVFEMAGQSDPVSVQSDALSACLRTLLDLPEWWTAPQGSVVLANRPNDPLWRVGVAGLDLGTLTWQASQAVTESLVRPSGPATALLSGPIGRPFQAVLGPAPRGYARRVGLAPASRYFERSAASWLAYAALSAFGMLPGRTRTEAPTWQWAGPRRTALKAACLRLSGTSLGALAPKVVFSGPFEPSGKPSTISFVRSKAAGAREPMNLFMASTWNEE